MKLLNLGCGTRYLKEWTNVDFIKTGPEVIACNLLKGIPFRDASFDVVYHSHVLEHLTRSAAIDFIKECYRVLVPGGIVRIAVPNLEEIIKEYLKNLSEAIEGDKEAENDYEWIMLELFDQMVRMKSGGDMGSYWTRPVIPNERYVTSRLGSEFSSFRENYKKNQQSFSEQSPQLGFRQKLIKWISGDDQTLKQLELGKFRLGGEIHQWMYDRYSLKKLLEQCEFKNVTAVTAFTSAIPDWTNHQWLDVEDGKVRKPDSLFMEAIK